jgi:hypothetical protein
MHLEASTSPVILADMRARRLVPVGGLVILAFSASVSSAAPNISCGRFIVGKANSTAYPNFQLPAQGSASGAPCSTLTRVARRLNAGTYKIPSGVAARPPSYGPPFSVRDAGRIWFCRLQNRGLSGPSYAVRCSRGATRLRWQVG